MATSYHRFRCLLGDNTAKNTQNHLASRRDDLDRSALQDMIMGAQPRVLVVVNRSVPNWIETNT